VSIAVRVHKKMLHRDSFYTNLFTFF